MRNIEIFLSLECIEPTVSRTMLVPEHTSLEKLHLILVAAMGWPNSSKYLFEAGITAWAPPSPDCDGMDLPPDKTTLAEALLLSNDSTMLYFNNFKKGWEHRLRANCIVERDSGILSPCLVRATGKCPPENVSDVIEYYEAIDDGPIYIKGGLSIPSYTDLSTADLDELHRRVDLVPKDEAC